MHSGNNKTTKQKQTYAIPSFSILGSVMTVLIKFIHNCALFRHEQRHYFINNTYNTNQFTNMANIIINIRFEPASLKFVPWVSIFATRLKLLLVVKSQFQWLILPLKFALIENFIVFSCLWWVAFKLQNIISTV